MLYKGIYKSFYWVSPLFIVALIAIAKKEDKFKKNKVVELIVLRISRPIALRDQF